MKIAFAVPLLAALAAAQSTTIIKTTTIIDGKGQVLRNKEIVVENGKIARKSAAMPPISRISISAVSP